MQGLPGPSGPSGPTGPKGDAGAGFAPNLGTGIFDAFGLTDIFHPAIGPGSFIMATYYDNQGGQAGVAIMVRGQGIGTARLDGHPNRAFKFGLNMS